MGMEMYIRSGPPELIGAMAADDDTLAGWLTDGSGWDANRMWWAALDLLFGPGGVEHLDGDELTGTVGFTPVMRMAAADVAELADGIADVDVAVISERFDTDQFGDPLGPDVQPDDREWLCTATLRLAALLRDAAGAGHDLVWVVV